MHFVGLCYKKNLVKKIVFDVSYNYTHVADHILVACLLCNPETAHIQLLQLNPFGRYCFPKDTSSVVPSWPTRHSEMYKRMYIFKLFLLPQFGKFKVSVGQRYRWIRKGKSETTLTHVHVLFITSMAPGNRHTGGLAEGYDFRQTALLW